nr:DUF4345 family protein [Nocardia cyriacigeorgica]
MRILVLALAAVFFGGMAFYAFAAPASLAHPFRLEVGSAESRSEIRAVYGGFGLAMALVLGWSAAGESAAHSGAATAVGVALAGMAGGRVVSRMRDGPTAFYPIWFYFLVETVGAGAILAVA